MYVTLRSYATAVRYLTRSTAVCCRSFLSSNRRNCESLSSPPGVVVVPTAACGDSDSPAPETDPGRFINSIASACSWTRVRSSMAHWRLFHSADHSRQNTTPASHTTSVATSNAGPIICKHNNRCHRHSQPLSSFSSPLDLKKFVVSGNMTKNRVGIGGIFLV